MAKTRESVTLDEDVSKGIHEEAKKRRDKFSPFVNKILYDFLVSIGRIKEDK